MDDPAIVPDCRTEVVIRTAAAEDAEAVALVLERSFAEYVKLYTCEGYAATILNPDRVLQRMTEGPTWVAELDHEIVGTVSAVPKGAHTLYVRGMAVLPSARGQRIGEVILNAVQEFAIRNGCRELLLSTTPFLHSAIRLYERSGFRRSEDGACDLFGTPLFMMNKVLSGTNESR